MFLVSPRGLMAVIRCLLNSGGETRTCEQEGWFTECFARNDFCGKDHRSMGTMPASPDWLNMVIWMWYSHQIDVLGLARGEA